MIPKFMDVGWWLLETDFSPCSYPTLARDRTLQSREKCENNLSQQSCTVDMTGSSSVIVPVAFACWSSSIYTFRTKLAALQRDFLVEGHGFFLLESFFYGFCWRREDLYELWMSSSARKFSFASWVQKMQGMPVYENLYNRTQTRDAF